MTDRPIIFSGPMIRALIAGTKTQTRRLATSPLAKCLPGDRLYVREAFASTFCPGMGTSDPVFVYRDVDNRTDYGGPWRPSIHMPRAASRLTLVVKDVRRQRLQEIGDDWRAEGVREVTYNGQTYYDYGTGAHRAEADGVACHPFQTLWNSLHGDKPGEAWRDNPEIVALTFDVHVQNIDSLPLAA